MHDEVSNVLLKCHFCMEHRTQTVQFKIADSCGRSFAMGASAAATSLQRNAVVDGSYVCDGCNTEYRVEIIVREGVFSSVTHSR